MEFAIECSCASCDHAAFTIRINQVIEELTVSYPAIGWFGEARVTHSEKFFWQANNYVEMFGFIVSCGLLKRATDSHLKWIMRRLYYDTKLNEFDGLEEDENGQDVYAGVIAPVENDHWETAYDDTDNLTKATMRLGSVREIIYPIEIVNGSDINACALLKECKIQITYAASRLTEGEIAFIIGHEEAHLDMRHITKMKDLFSEADLEMDKIIKDKSRGTISKALHMIFVGATAIAATPLISKECEIACDLAAKKRMQEAGYGQDDILRFLKRLGTYQGTYFSSHPAPQFRVKMLED